MIITSRFRAVPRVVLLLCLALSVTQASDVIVTTTTDGLLRYTTQPVGFYRSWVASPEFIKVLATPDKAKVYSISRDAILVLSGDFNTELSSIKLTGATNAWLSPNGGRLLVAAADTLIFDTSTDEEVGPSRGLGLNGISSVAFSADSKLAYLFSGTTRKVTILDLTTLHVGLSVDLGTSELSLQLAPNGLLYGVTASSLYELDPITLATRVRSAFGGTVEELIFSADGKMAYSVNVQAATAGPILVYDLDTHTLSRTIGALGSKFRNLVPVDANRVWAINTDTGRISVAFFSTGGSIEQAITGSSAPYEDVVQLIPSEESPYPRYVYAVQKTRVVKIEAATNKAVSESPIWAGTAESGVYAKSPATGAAAMLMSYGSGQSISAGAKSGPFGVRVMNAAGQPLSGVTITFAGESSSVVVESPSVTTNPEGYAYTRVTAPATIGSYSLTATTAALKASYTFAVTAAVPGDGGGGTIPGGAAIYSGNGQIVGSGMSGSAPLVVSVRDANGLPLETSAVRWTVKSGTVVLANPTLTNTDSNGLARINFTGAALLPGMPFVPSIVTATTSVGSIDFYVTTFPISSLNQVNDLTIRLIKPTSTNFTLTGSVGATLASAIQVSVATNMGQTAVPNIGIEVFTGLDPLVGPTAACAGGSALTDSTGKASCDVVLGGLKGNASLTVQVGSAAKFMPMPLTVLPGAAAQITPIQGNNVTATPGQKINLIAQVSDAGGNLLPGTAVQWELVTAGTGTLSKTTDTANSAGQVNSTFTVGAVSGPIQVRARAGSAVYAFTITVNLPVGSFEKVEGADNQSAKIGTDFKNPIAVKVLTSDGQPIPGALVSFAVTSGTGTLSASSAAAGSDGIASVIAHAPNVAGNLTVTATLGTRTLSFTLTAIPPGPAIKGFYDIASFEQGLTPGALVRMIGTGLATGVEGSVFGSQLGGQWPEILEGVSVKIAGINAPLYAVSNVNGEESVTLQVPFEVPGGTVSVEVKVDENSTTLSDVQVLEYHPGLYMVSGSDGKPHGLVIRPDGSLVSPSNPAKRGEILRTYASGLGPVSPSAATNTVGTGGQKVLTDVIVGVNHAGMRVLSAEYAQNLLGVYEVTFELASDTATGSDRSFLIAVRVGGGTVNSNETTIAITE